MLFSDPLFSRLPRSQNGGSQAESVSHNPVVCEDYDSIICSVVLDSTPTFISVEVVSISDNISSQPVYLRIPAQPGQSLSFFLYIYKEVSLAVEQNCDASLYFCLLKPNNILTWQEKKKSSKK